MKGFIRKAALGLALNHLVWIPVFSKQCDSRVWLVQKVCLVNGYQSETAVFIIAKVLTESYPVSYSV